MIKTILKQKNLTENNDDLSFARMSRKGALRQIGR
jgi:hypothetical protein